MLTPRHTPQIRDEIIDHSPGYGWLRKAPLYWASDEMSALAHSQRSEMPAWTPSQCRPAPRGLLVLEEEAGALEALQRLHSGVTALKLVFAWRTLEDGALEISCFSYSPGVDIAELFTITVPSDQTLPLSEDELTETPDWDQLRETAVHKNLSHTSLMGHDSAALLGCAWILMQLPSVATPEKVRVKKARDKKTRSKQQKYDTIQLIHLRSAGRSTPAEERESSGSREYHVRWVVKGHWRQQRVGPGRKFRKPTYIAPHVKGPENAPLKTERVHIWDR